MFMLLGLLKSAVPKVIAFILLAAIVFFSVTYIKDSTRTDTLKDFKIEQIEKEIIIRKKVNDFLEENRESNPNRDGAIALDRLRERYSDPE